MNRYNVYIHYSCSSTQEEAPHGVCKEEDVESTPSYSPGGFVGVLMMLSFILAGMVCCIGITITRIQADAYAECPMAGTILLVAFSGMIVFVIGALVYFLRHNTDYGGNDHE